MNASAVYQQVGQTNVYHGRQAVRIIATYINWKAIGEDPAVIVENSARIKGRIHLAEPKELNLEPVAIVGFGPSLKDTWKDVRKFKKIFTCSGAHKFLIEHGIVPTYHVDSDPRAYKADILGNPHPLVTYMISSICHPTYFDKLELYRSRVWLWHMLFLEPEIFKYFPVNEWILTGGHTVGPRAIKIAALMGYCNLHMFGFDGSVQEDATHATKHPAAPSDFVRTKVGGKTYVTTNNWQDHAEILLKDFDRMPEVVYEFHGDGLIQAMAAQHVPIERAKMPPRVFKGEDGQCYW